MSDNISFCSKIPSMTQQDKYDHEHQLAKNYINSLSPMERLGLSSDPRTAMAQHIITPMLHEASQRINHDLARLTNLNQF